ncbi:MAG: glycosyl transferase [Sphingobacteriia bacterium 24-36-13]|uniref:glycosyltransferase family 2 protein n=1 Tax=Sediminibacterium sp. TaxID=1917865 RepID=UPI000BCF435A|nr:glycosyltransferase family 2 protein [Sediminibacterium sp.]OYZ53406.1 MAG: glycosyl transferase [Sphingobacteriia bacterium 24-36-13]OZA65073.1 MAG: glycosyl transferase [Sphingobacteriia bacterium 39-36-14]HQS25275.1 glycosyltransferase family 2 protein [Sediminibacterium sp.]HQS35164.1 glycosyltransferase family 2 protein [Sediminibacterium sp.]
MPVCALNNMISVGLFTTAKLEEIDVIADEFEYAQIKAALNFGYLTRKLYVSFLERSGFPLVDVRNEVLDESFVEQCDLLHLNAFLYLPMRNDGKGNLLVAAADPMDERLQGILEIKFNTKIKLVAASDLDITWMVHKLRGEYYVKESVFSLMRKDPESSGLTTFTDAQLLFIFIAIGFALLLLTVNFVNSFIFFNLFFSFVFLFSIVFKLYIALKGSKYELVEVVTKEEVKAVKNDTLPVYTILLPVYKEDKLIRKLIWNLRSLDYPRGKLDVKLLIEEDDDKTLNAVRNLDFPANFETIVVPFHMPKTKPKACNYGLFFCKGIYLTIYDAEDVPDSDQLKKVVSLFRKLPKDYVVLQGALNYFNKNENLLTRMFTLEYSYWFDYMLPGLQSLDVPIPLGGTSNHFKLDKLKELGGWDPFNVTEDADLGVRVFEKRYKVGVVNSTTLEEANNEPFNWIRQRSRWIKGYMQTLLVHMRNPIRLVNKIGWRGFFGFNFFVGFTPITFLLYPVLLGFYIIYIIFDLQTVRVLFPDWVLYISIFNFVAGNTLMIYVNMLAVFKRRFYELILFALVNPFYWLMHSIAAYKGLWQLIYKPFYWEKTNHGLTKMSHSSSAAAAANANEVK